ncbi:hypothetical protein DFH29DRAFT_1065096 [Suillus ampliporus]|nr:hypothetical protein DFH29DRAFT_1065096 [Suillus ampliporus]
MVTYHIMNATNSSTVTAPGEDAPASVATFNVYVMIGPVAVGALVNACLFGSLVVQIHVYYANFANDHRAMKLMVAAILASQIAHVICVSATLWNVAVSGYGNPLSLQIFPLGADAAILFTGITGLLVESSFAFRLWKLSKRLPLLLLSLALCLLTQSISLAVAVKAFLMTSLVTFVTDQNTLIMLAFISRVVCELTLTLSIVWYLRKQRSSTFPRTTSAIDRLVLWTIGKHRAHPHRYDSRPFNHTAETGLTTSLVGILVMSFFLVMKHNCKRTRISSSSRSELFSDIWVGLYANLATVNANSFLASLNGRLIFRKSLNDSLHMTTLSSSDDRGSKYQPFVINVTRTATDPRVPEVFKYDESEV